MALNIYKTLMTEVKLLKLTLPFKYRSNKPNSTSQSNLCFHHFKVSDNGVRKYSRGKSWTNSHRKHITYGSVWSGPAVVQQRNSRSPDFFELLQKAIEVS